MNQFIFHPDVVRDRVSEDFASHWRRKGYDPQNFRHLPSSATEAYIADPYAGAQRLMEEELVFRDRLVLPICPCCGQGRTLFVHFATQPALVIPAQFSDWCDRCRRELASKLK